MKTNFYRGTRICCISDIHAGVHQNSSLWHGISYEWAEWLADELRARDIEDIQISGDLFHYRNEISVDTLHHVVKLLHIWDDFNISILVGNHDAFYKETSEVNSLEMFAEWPNITVFSQVKQVESHGRTFAMVPWGTKTKDIPVSDYVFGHFELKFFKMTVFQMCEHGEKPAEIAKRCNNAIITGHFHLRDQRNFGDKTILYTGSPFHLDLGDEGSTKGFYILDAETDEIEFVENYVSPKYVKLKLSELVEYDGMTDELEKLIHNNFVRFYLDIKINNTDLITLQNFLMAKKPVSIDIEREFDEKLVLSDDILDIKSVDSKDILAEYIDMLEIENPTQLKQYMINLYNKHA